MLLNGASPSTRLYDLYLLFRRASDGIHWLPMPVRHMTNLLLTHIGELYFTYIWHYVYTFLRLMDSHICLSVALQPSVGPWLLFSFLIFMHLVGLHILYLMKLKMVSDETALNYSYLWLTSFLSSM
jgi:hypothetical protein